MPGPALVAWPTGLVVKQVLKVNTRKLSFQADGPPGNLKFTRTLKISKKNLSAVLPLYTVPPYSLRILATSVWPLSRA